MITTTINPESMSAPAATFETETTPPDLIAGLAPGDCDRVIVETMERFPSLRRHAAPIRAAGIFRIDSFVKAVEDAAHGSGAQHAARFIITLWSGPQYQDGRWRFDVTHAMQCWDQDHRAAFLAWAKNPRQP